MKIIGDPEQTPEALHFENLVFQSQIYSRGRKRTNNWLYLLFHNVRVYEAICYDLQFKILFASQQKLRKQTIYYLLSFQNFQCAIECAIEKYFEIKTVFKIPLNFYA